MQLPSAPHTIHFWNVIPKRQKVITHFLHSTFPRTLIWCQAFKITIFYNIWARTPEFLPSKLAECYSQVLPTGKVLCLSINTFHQKLPILAKNVMSSVSNLAENMSGLSWNIQDNSSTWSTSLQILTQNCSNTNQTCGMFVVTHSINTNFIILHRQHILKRVDISCVGTLNVTREKHPCLIKIGRTYHEKSLAKLQSSGMTQ